MFVHQKAKIMNGKSFSMSVLLQTWKSNWSNIFNCLLHLFWCIDRKSWTTSIIARVCLFSKSAPSLPSHHLPPRWQKDRQMWKTDVPLKRRDWLVCLGTPIADMHTHKLVKRDLFYYLITRNLQEDYRSIRHELPPTHVELNRIVIHSKVKLYLINM